MFISIKNRQASEQLAHRLNCLTHPRSAVLTLISFPFLYLTLLMVKKRIQQKLNFFQTSHKRCLLSLTLLYQISQLKQANHHQIKQQLLILFLSDWCPSPFKPLYSSLDLLLTSFDVLSTDLFSTTCEYGLCSYLVEWQHPISSYNFYYYNPGCGIAPTLFTAASEPMTNHFWFELKQKNGRNRIRKAFDGFIFREQKFASQWDYENSRQEVINQYFTSVLYRVISSFLSIFLSPEVSVILRQSFTYQLVRSVPMFSFKNLPNWIMFKVPLLLVSYLSKSSLTCF